MPIVAACVVPHPPLIFPEVGRGQEKEIQDTVDGYRKAAAKIVSLRPDTVVIVSPHATAYADYIHISPGAGAEGSMRQFGVAKTLVKAEYDAPFVENLARLCEEAGLPAGTDGERDKSLDHGTMIPMRFILEASGQQGEGGEIRFVRAGISRLPLPVHYEFGQLIAKTAGQLGRRTVIVASGDLSHRLLAEGPYGYTKEGPEFDKIVMEDVVGKADFGKLFEMPPDFCEKAGECGHRPLVVMAGALDGVSVTSEAYSHEGPFGVGYGIGFFEPEQADDSRRFLQRYLEREANEGEQRAASMSPQAALAWQTIVSHVKTGRKPAAPEDLPRELTDQRAGVFVSIKKHGELRGCIGTISPVTKSIAEEIRSNAVSASSHDPRFSPITADELPYLTVSVDVLGEAEDIAGEDELDPARYGVIVTLGGRRGLLLPDLEGIDDASTQVGIAMRKAGIPERERQRVSLQRFEVIRYI